MIAFSNPEKTALTVTVFNVEKRRHETVPVIDKSSDEWKRILTPEQYHVTVEKGTERPFDNPYDAHKEKGLYECVRCGNDLFSSETKFDSGTGWPSFWAPIEPENIVTRPEYRFSMERTEVLCARCQSHLGHVFDDGPPPTHKRYCMNSVALRFKKL